MYDDLPEIWTDTILFSWLGFVALDVMLLGEQQREVNGN